MGEAIGKSWRTIQDYEYHKSTQPLRTLKMFAITYGVSLKWLETGEGYMLQLDKSNYQSIKSSGNTQVNSGYIINNTQEFDAEIKEFAELLRDYSSKEFRSNLKARLLKFKSDSEL